MNNHMRTLPPSRRLNVIILGCWPVGPIGCVKWNQLDRLDQWHDGQFGEPQAHRLNKERFDLGIVEWQLADLVHDLATEETEAQVFGDAFAQLRGP